MFAPFQVTGAFVVATRRRFSQATESLVVAKATYKPVHFQNKTQLCQAADSLVY